MDEKIFEEDQDKIKDENNSLKKEVIRIDELSSSSKKKLIFFGILMILILIVIITLVVVFTLKKTNDEKDDDIEVLPPYVINSTSGNHTHTIIFTPGFSNTPEQFVNFLTNRIKLNKKNDTTIVILRSPFTNISVSKSQNYSWFDVYELPVGKYEDVSFEDAKKSAKVLEKVINNEVNLLNGDYEKIIVGGHSQGAILSLYHSYTTDKNYGGVFAFSGFLLPGEISNEKRNLKVFFGYGDKDEMIEPSFINQTIQRIKDFEGFDLHIYENQTHYINVNESNDATVFLNNIIK